MTLLGRLLGAMLVLAALAWAAPSPAQPRATARIGLMSLEAEPGAEPALRRLAPAAPTILARLEAQLGVRPARLYRMVLVPPAGIRDPEVARIDASAPNWAAGYLLPDHRFGAIRVAQAGRYPYGTLEAVLAHEATHQLVHDSGARVPLWFNEGVATRLGRRWNLDDAFLYATSLLTSHLPALTDLDAWFQGDDREAQLAYAASFEFVSWASSRHGERLVRDVLHAARTRPFGEAWRAVTGSSLADDERAWRRGTLFRYRWLPLLGASSTLWLGVTALALAAGVRKRARARRVREQWAREEAAGAGDPFEGEWAAAPSDGGSPPSGPDEPGKSPNGQGADER